MKELAWLLFFCGLIMIFTAANHLTPRDATDSPTDRSGMSLYTDYGTGCQYVGTPFGGLTPRLDADGLQVCGVTP